MLGSLSNISLVHSILLKMTNISGRNASSHSVPPHLHGKVFNLYVSPIGSDPKAETSKSMG